MTEAENRAKEESRKRFRGGEHDVEMEASETSSSATPAKKATTGGNTALTSKRVTAISADSSDDEYDMVSHSV
jgi:hypothetical protein